jgi:multisubunit Na+/H+ antiporter MnhB subunit
MASVHGRDPVSVGPGIGAIVVGLVLLTFGVAYLRNYRGIADYTLKKDVEGWESMPFLGRRIAKRVAETTSVRTVRLFNGVTLTAAGTVGVVLGVLSLALR